MHSIHQQSLDSSARLSREDEIIIQARLSFGGSGRSGALVLLAVLPLSLRLVFIFGVLAPSTALYAGRRALGMTRSLLPLRVHGPVQGPRPYNGMLGCAHPMAVA